MNEKHGLIVKPITSDQFIFGAGQLGDSAVNPSGQWTAYLPTPESQNFGFEPSACVSFATLNCVETMMRHRYGETLNFSDRFLAYISGTACIGNDMHSVPEALRTKGVVTEHLWPYSTNLNTCPLYYQTPPQELYTEALLFTSGFNFGHSWVSPANPAAMMRALTYSPLAVAVYAWQKEGDLYVNPSELPPGHAVMIYGYKKGEYWLALDTYAPHIKKLAWDFPFVYVKRFTLDRKTLQQALPVWKQILNYCLAQLLIIKSKLGLWTS